MNSTDLKGLLKEPLKMIKGILMRSRYLRLTPNQRGRIWFFDLTRRRFFCIASRGYYDSFTADQIFTYDEYALDGLIRKADIDATFSAILDAGKTPLIIDCGGNIGLASRKFAEDYPEARVICVEPNSDNLRLAKRNCARFANVVFHHAAVGATSGHVSILDEAANPNAYRVSPSRSESRVDMVSMTRLIAQNPDCAPFIAKIDIEGFEDNLFAENTEWIDGCPLMIVELHDWMLPGTANSANFLKAIAARNRDFVFRGENVFSIRNPSLD
jgi:FkbM family methyltransferase